MKLSDRITTAALLLAWIAVSASIGWHLAKAIVERLG